MDTLQILAAALGLAALAGLNLYLTVFVLSMSLNMGWLVLDPQFAGLQVVAHPVILTLSGVLTFVEFFADKISWVDSIWDSIHTIIRPVGAAVLSITVLGSMEPVMEVAMALVCGGVALTTHATKAGMRLIVNASPEPLTNVAVSFLENIGVIGGLIFLYKFPLIAAAIVAIFVISFCLIAPMFLRTVFVTFRYIIHAIFRFAFGNMQDAKLLNTLPVAEREQLAEDLGNENITWAIHALTGKNKNLTANQPAYLVYLQEAEKIGLIVRKKPNRWLSTEGLEVHGNRKFLFDELSLYHRPTGESIILRFFKSHRPLLKKVILSLNGEDMTQELPTTVLGSFR